MSTQSSQSYSLAFASPAADYIKENDVRNVVEVAIINVIEHSGQNEYDGTFGIVDVNSKSFIKYKVLENYI